MVIYRVNDFTWIIISGNDGKVLGDVYLIKPSNFEVLDEFEGEEYIRMKLRTSTDVYCGFMYINMIFQNLQRLKVVIGY
jgi:gamma-glutamylcyclotransferase (GGCT)/AIG2-like uncharacterized protein YtfP